MSAKWLAQSYDYLLDAAINAGRRGEIATVGMAAMVDRMFMQGAGWQEAR